MAGKINKTQRLSQLNTQKSINKWFLEHMNDHPNTLRQNKTWQTIKYYVDKMGYYKAKSRGNPSAGRKAQLASKTNTDNIGAGGDTTYEQVYD